MAVATKDKLVTLEALKVVNDRVKPITEGGTGATTVKSARASLGCAGELTLTETSWGGLYTQLCNISTGTAATYSCGGGVTSVLTGGAEISTSYGIVYRATDLIWEFEGRRMESNYTYAWRVTFASGGGSATVSTFYKFIGGTTTSSLRRGIYAAGDITLTGTTWSALYSQLCEIPTGYSAMYSTANGSVTSVLTGGSDGSISFGIAYRATDLIWEFEGRRMTSGVNYAWRVTFASGGASATVDTFYKFFGATDEKALLRSIQAATGLHLTGTSWKDLNDELVSIPTNYTATFECTGDITSLLTGSKINSIVFGVVSRPTDTIFDFMAKTPGNQYLCAWRVTFSSAGGTATVGTVYRTTMEAI